MLTIIAFIIILGVLVLVHELGHFITARRTGMRVYEFGIGFPPRIGGLYRDKKTKKLKWVWGKGKSSLKETVGGKEGEEEFSTTLYSFNWLPIGGFVKIKGENGEDSDESDSFGYKPAWKRVVVLASGVLMNIVLAAVLISAGFIIGLPVDFSQGVDERAIVVQPASVVIQQVVPDSPAKEAGLRFGDKIFKIDDREIANTGEMISYVKEKGSSRIIMHIDRAGEELAIPVVPKVSEGKPAQIGVYLADAGIIRYPWYLSIYQGVISTGIGIVNISVAFWKLITELILGKGLAFSVAGPVGIAVIIGQSARLGISHLLSVTAMISLSLAVINILPIPALDGGRIIFILLEKIFRRPMPMKYEQMAHTIGFLMLMGLVLLVTWNDIVGLF